MGSIKLFESVNEEEEQNAPHTKPEVKKDFSLFLTCLYPPRGAISHNALYDMAAPGVGVCVNIDRP